ncbi:MarR family winged helix-turn-helix transcriptional regulator [Actinokineospora sp.]|uniref:MarR family winged helix-turn-helix transcriptional regulator n=1 Tax=Actinokineospora sp. TaxID=1872133 RepID=UPI003D6B257A
MTEPQPLVPGTVGDHTSCLLVKLGQVMFRLAEEELPGLRVRHYSILQALADNGPTPQLALGAYLRIDPATMVSSLDDLENAGHAARVRDPGDRRRYLVEITESGRTVLAGANERLGELDDQAFAELSSTDRKSLHRILSKLASGATLPAAFDAIRDQPASRKLPSSQRASA